jgi:two-component system, chemotaxis family, CheB/CheR fusion protein
MTKPQSDEQMEAQFDTLLDYLSRTRGFDFTAYKRSSLMRRINKRAQMVGLDMLGDYMDFLEVHPEEFGLLFNSILINVTSFFRDPPTWEYVSQEIIPRIVASKGRGEQIRVWSAGCASGQEAYSLAMLLSEALSPEQFRQQVKVYATDVDEESLSEARAASYAPDRVEGIPPQLLDKYFDKVNGRYIFQRDLRRSVIFGRHDLIQDAPISRVDLLVCRNTLMYFNAEAQARIMSRFDFALNPGGFLFLGKAEVMLSRINGFIPADPKGRIFIKNSRNRPNDRLIIPLPRYIGDGDSDSQALGEQRLRSVALEIDPNAQLVVDMNGALALANEAARNLLAIGSVDIGRPLSELSLTQLPVDLHALIDQISVERRPRTIRDVEVVSDGIERRFLDVTATPLLVNGSGSLGTKVVLTDVTRIRRLQDELHQSHQELETTNEELQSSNEELETTNEELQSTVEELETTNEELQSTNEELETMNEELQSTNEELESSNEELRQRSAELDEANAFMTSILGGLREGVIVLDRNLQVLAWNSRSEDLWGLRAEEVRGKHLLNLDIGLPMEQLKQPIRSCFVDGGSDQEVSFGATNRRGKPIQVRVTCTRLRNTTGGVHSVILFIEEVIN